MKAEVASAWADALESGVYRQGKGRMARVDQIDGQVSYCCLGVLSELAYQAGVVVERSYEWIEDGDQSIFFDGRGAFPPESVQKWAGLDKGNPLLWASDLDPDTSALGEGELLPASAINDDYQQNFNQIAARIRETYL